jgi:hypothetical protein
MRPHDVAKRVRRRFERSAALERFASQRLDELVFALEIERFLFKPVPRPGNGTLQTPDRRPTRWSLRTRFAPRGDRPQRTMRVIKAHARLALCYRRSGNHLPHTPGRGAAGTDSPWRRSSGWHMPVTHLGNALMDCSRGASRPAAVNGRRPHAETARTASRRFSCVHDVVAPCSTGRRSSWLVPAVIMGARELRHQRLDVIYSSAALDGTNRGLHAPSAAARSLVADRDPGHERPARRSDAWHSGRRSRAGLSARPTTSVCRPRQQGRVRRAYDWPRRRDSTSSRTGVIRRSSGSCRRRRFRQTGDSSCSMRARCMPDGRQRRCCELPRWQYAAG